MKKRLFLILALCLIAALLCTLVACGGKTEGETKAGADVGTNESGNAGSNGTTGEGGGNGGNAGGNGAGTKVMASRDSVESAIGSLFKIAAQSSSGSALTTVASDGTYTYYANPGVVFAKVIGNSAYSYVKQSGSSKYTKMNVPNDVADLLAIGNVGNIFLYAGETISYQTETAVTFLNRPAKKYTYEGTGTGGYASITEEIIIDDATGACLKHVSQGVATDGFTGGAQKASFEVTEFEYGAGNTTARAFLNALIDQVDIYEWDTAFMTEIGLAAVNAPNWKLSQTRWASGCTRDSEYPWWEADYQYVTDDAAGTTAGVRAVLQAFYNAGAKLDEEGVQKTFDELCWYDAEDNSFSFHAYVVGNPTYEVIIHADYETFLSPHRWTIGIEIGVEEL